MLTRDWFALDQCDTLTQLEIVERLVTAYPARYLSKGAAVRALLDKAIQQVVVACRASSDQGSQRVADFLERRQRGESVTAIAQAWGFSREYVSRSTARPAIRLVTERVLALGRRTLAVASDGQPDAPASLGPQRIA